MREVIVMDRDLERRDFFYEILTQMNCEVTTIPAFSELIERLKRARPDCIILDIESTGRDFKSVLTCIKEIDDSVKIIALTIDDMQRETGAQLDKNGNVICVRHDIKSSQLIPVLLRALREKEVEIDEQKIAPKGRFLIVDDEVEASSMIKNYFIRKGYDVDTACSGEEALLKIKSRRPDLVVLDIMMPGMDGLLVLKHIKKIDSSIVVIVASGTYEQHIIDSALALGAVKYLNKPFSLDNLEAMILMGMAGVMTEDGWRKK
ncbi:MAG: response regulator [Candidatus Omnitrophica bacterium]|nr:response regulator [Candidatus Omnitrophota bacterium]